MNALPALTTWIYACPGIICLTNLVHVLIVAVSRYDHSTPKRETGVSHSENKASPFHFAALMSLQHSPLLLTHKCGWGTHALLPRDVTLIYCRLERRVVKIGRISVCCFLSSVLWEFQTDRGEFHAELTVTHGCFSDLGETHLRVPTETRSDQN